MRAENIFIFLFFSLMTKELIKSNSRSPPTAPDLITLEPSKTFIGRPHKLHQFFFFSFFSRFLLFISIWFYYFFSRPFLLHFFKQILQCTYIIHVYKYMYIVPKRVLYGCSLSKKTFLPKRIFFFFSFSDVSTLHINQTACALFKYIFSILL